METCDLCGKEFKNTRSLGSHKGVVHPNKQPKEGEEMVEQSELEKKAAALGIDIPEAVKLIKPLIDQSVEETLNKMNIVGALTAAIDTRIEEKTSAISAEVKTLLEQVQTAQQAKAPGEQGDPLQHPLVIALGQKILGGGSGGNNDFKGFFEAMASFQKASADLYWGPRQQAQKEVIDIMKAGYGIGLNTQQVIDGAAKNLAEKTDSQS